MKCTICKTESEKLTHLELNITGSEGIDVCPLCRMNLAEYAEQLMLNYLRDRKFSVADQIKRVTDKARRNYR